MQQPRPSTNHRGRKTLIQIQGNSRFSFLQWGPPNFTAPATAPRSVSREVLSSAWKTSDSLLKGRKINNFPSGIRRRERAGNCFGDFPRGKKARSHVADSLTPCRRRPWTITPFADANSVGLHGSFGRLQHLQHASQCPRGCLQFGLIHSQSYSYLANYEISKNSLMLR